MGPEEGEKKDSSRLDRGQRKRASAIDLMMPKARGEKFLSDLKFEMLQVENSFEASALFFPVSLTLLNSDFERCAYMCTRTSGLNTQKKREI